MSFELEARIDALETVLVLLAQHVLRADRETFMQFIADLHGLEDGLRKRNVDSTIIETVRRVRLQLTEDDEL